MGIELSPLQLSRGRILHFSQCNTARESSPHSAELILSCGFELSEITGPSCGFLVDDPQWITWRGLTPDGPLTGPSRDHTTGTDRGMYVRDTKRRRSAVVNRIRGDGDGGKG